MVTSKGSFDIQVNERMKWTIATRAESQEMTKSMRIVDVRYLCWGPLLPIYGVMWSNRVLFERSSPLICATKFIGMLESYRLTYFQLASFIGIAGSVRILLPTTLSAMNLSAMISVEIVMIS